MTGTDREAFRLEGVTKRFGDFVALSDVSLRVDRGEMIGLIGPSGAGKTTLLRILAGMLQPSEGRTLVGGHMVAKLSRLELRAVRRATGFIHQSLDLVPELRVVSNVLAGRLGFGGLWEALRLLTWPRRDDLVEVHRCLERVALTEKMYERSSKLSGGQAQRVAIARVLFQDPTAILADEPVSAVDPARARDLLEILARINAETGKTIVVSLHAIDLARRHCGRLIGMREGRIFFDRKAEEVTDAELDRLYDLGGAVT
ncbi:MAG: ATP-binding cassette domain-containing protein [Planctomycetes bacterium]|nr:ATP-binding cassette domain-containing protein [Planctomycetota bacterium]